MSILDDSLIRTICPHLPKDMKYGPILWTYVIREVWTASSQCVNLLKQALLSLCLNRRDSENIIAFTTQFLQLCNDLGKNVPSEAPFLLNEQFLTASVQQFHTKFMAQRLKVNAWVHHIHGMTHDNHLGHGNQTQLYFC